MSNPSSSSGEGTPRALIISFHADPRDLADPSDLAHFPARAARVAKQAEVLGGKLCAFGAFSMSFAFVEADLEDPIAWAGEVGGRENALPRFSVGISFGDLTDIVEPQGPIAISWGRALLVSAALAASAHPEEILVDPDIPGIEEVVRTTGRRWVSGGETAIAALSLDPARPLMSESGAVFIEPDDLADLQDGPGATIAEQARQALLRGDIESLDTALAELKPTGAHPELVERLGGLLALNRGEKDEGLRMLRQATETETRPRFKTRAHLAYAIALASAGRSESALLEALTSLALARDTQDRTGEAATARFLSQLSTVTGHTVAASVWEHVVELASASAE